MQTYGYSYLLKLIINRNILKWRSWIHYYFWPFHYGPVSSQVKRFWLQLRLTVTIKLYNLNDLSAKLWSGLFTLLIFSYFRSRLLHYLKKEIDCRPITYIVDIDKEAPPLYPYILCRLSFNDFSMFVYIIIAGCLQINNHLELSIERYN